LRDHPQPADVRPVVNELKAEVAAKKPYIPDP
jgi:hypothetical protein